jgi:predicted patatin/cPLA2 family phospholipase
MKIDTLILSGASTRGVIFLGCLNYLIEKGLIKSNFENINKIYCVSVSYMFVLSIILLKYDYDKIKEDAFNFNFNDFLDINDISIKNFINDYGLINYNKNHIYIKKLLKEYYNVDKMSLLKLYKLTGKHIIVKVVNVSKEKIEYIDHINNPKMNILKLLQMTTAIPILLKPIKYKGDLYLDGGLSGNCPIEINNSKNYLCIYIVNRVPNKEMNNIFDFVYKGWHMYDPDILIRKDNERTKIIHTYKLNLNLSDFNISIEQKKKMLNLGYDSMKEHFIGLQ